MSATRSVSCPNPHLSALSSDNLYHIGFLRNDELKKLFSDVKFVVMGGSPRRMESFAKLVAKEIGCSIEDHTSRTDRYSLYKIGPVISVNHGMGVPSITILLHEIIKLLHYAEAQDPIIIRIGTCGGIDVEPGTVVISERALNSTLKEAHDTVILGEVVSRPSRINRELAVEIKESHADKTFSVMLGTTMCTDDFYEGQGRIDGAICEYSESDQQEYLQKLKEKGVNNIEMECSAMAALCLRASVRCAIVCVVLVDRLEGDQVDPTTYQAYGLRPQNLVVQYITKKLKETKTPVV